MKGHYTLIEHWKMISLLSTSNISSTINCSAKAENEHLSVTLNQYASENLKQQTNKLFYQLLDVLLFRKETLKNNTNDF